jgi:hypothetical protein
LLITADAGRPDVLVTRIGLDCGERPVIVVCGASDLAGSALDCAESVLGPAVASAAETAGAAVVDEGTGHEDGEAGLPTSVAAALAETKPVALVLAGGGDAAFAETLAAARQGWTIFAVEGTGGLADRIATQWR